MNIGQSINDFENWRDSQHDVPQPDCFHEPERQEIRHYTHDYPNDTIMEYSLHGDNAILRLTFSSEDDDLGSEEMVYCGEQGESMDELVTDLRQELTAYMDSQDQDSFFRQQGMSVSDEIHSVEDYYGEFSRTALYAFEGIMKDFEREMAGELKWHPIEGDKVDWLYSARSEADAERGCIGHLRGDFGRDGTEFWTSWFDHQPQLKNSDFRDELQNVVNKLRGEGGLLQNFASMRNGCNFGRAMDDCYGFRAESSHYEYCLRCTPRRGGYNFYLYCYSKEAQREHARTKAITHQAEKHMNKSKNKEMER